MRRILFTVLTAALLSAACHAQLQLDQLWKKASKTPTAAVLSDDRITAGLKEALTISTRSAVSSTGRPDGFLKNTAIKILIPPKLHTLDKGMRMIGKGAEMDELEVGMNRAAEEAAPEAKKIFLDALARMTFDDARRILSEGDTAATEYFKQQTSAELARHFSQLCTANWRPWAWLSSTTSSCAIRWLVHCWGGIPSISTTMSSRNRSTDSSICWRKKSGRSAKIRRSRRRRSCAMSSEGSCSRRGKNFLQPWNCPTQANNWLEWAIAIFIFTSNRQTKDLAAKDRYLSHHEGLRGSARSDLSISQPCIYCDKLRGSY